MATGWKVGVATGPRDSERRDPFLLGTVICECIQCIHVRNIIHVHVFRLYSCLYLQLSCLGGSTGRMRTRLEALELECVGG